MATSDTNRVPKCANLPPRGFLSTAGLVLVAVLLGDRWITAVAEHPLDIIGVESSPNSTLVACTLLYPPFVYRRPEAAMDPREGQNESTDDVESVPGLERVYSLADFMADFSGFDVDFLSALRVAALNGSSIQVALYNSFYSALYSTRLGRCDLAIGAFIKSASRMSCGCPHPDISNPTRITPEHACCLEFSQTYASDGLAAMTRARTSMTPFQSFMDTMLTQTSLTLWSVLLIALIISSNLMWYIERNSNSVEFPYPYVDGVSDGLWWSIVTMTTVGYGDKTPRTRLGRLIGVVWMGIGVVMSGLIIGIISESMANARQQRGLRNVLRLADLRHDRICYVSGIFTKYINRETFDSKPITAVHIDDCYEMLDREEVDAVVGVRLDMLQEIDDGAMGKYSSLKRTGLEISAILVQSNFAAVFPSGSPYRQYFTHILGHMMAGGVVYSPNTDIVTADQGWILENARRRYMAEDTDPYIPVAKELTQGGGDDDGNRYTVDPEIISLFGVAFFVGVAQTLALIFGPAAARHLAKCNKKRVKVTAEPERDVAAKGRPGVDVGGEIAPKRPSMWEPPAGSHLELTRVEAAAMDIKAELEQLAEMVHSMNSVMAGVESAVSRSRQASLNRQAACSADHIPSGTPPTLSPKLDP